MVVSTGSKNLGDLVDKNDNTEYIEDGKNLQSFRAKLEHSHNAFGAEFKDKEGLTLKLDKHGVPLSPQPSDDPEDPLNWSGLYRTFILIQVSILSALGTYNTAIINPAYNQLSEQFGVSIVTASYQTTVVIAVNGLGPFLFIPFAHVYGRRPVYLFTTFIGAASALGCAYAQNFSQLVGLRILNGIFPVGAALGVATANDLFCLHERGRALGVYTVLSTTGAHFAPIPGGLIGQFLGWQWIFKFAAITNSFCLLFTFFFLPETLYIRGQTIDAVKDFNSTPNNSFRRYWRRMNLGKRYAGRKLRISDFFWPYVKMIRYPSVVFPAIYYGTQYGLGSTLPAVTVSHIFAQEFGWDTLQIGLAYGTALLIGAFLGETAGGWVVDSIMNRARRKALTGPSAPSEIRLRAIWTGEIIVPIGLLWYGFSIQFRAPWIVPIIGMGVACFGVQCITTVIADCHLTKSAEVAQVFNFVRQEIGMTFAFYAIVLGEAIGGYHLLFIFFACVGSILAFIPILVLMWKGEAIRAAEQRVFAD
ncbi:MFS general substrate transporter [Lentinula aciculospora]|uniref:MFS general substrate transporter n=1 Tax=Lentinula aciculospora TaxID=153920 RepID=A0A9W8ZU43_9AGAR|nr:MFS general substrate transporter [Lentinula aciculospora]